MLFLVIHSLYFLLYKATLLKENFANAQKRKNGKI